MTTPTQFGRYFRERRKALGLGLREFCRRNGLDPGKISKLERGLLPPPASNETLAPYAKALGLTDPQQERFYQLARDDRSAKLPTPPRSMPRSTRNRAIDLEQWADRIEARHTLPIVLRRLVHATMDAPHLVKVDFPADEGVQRPGWDGVVAATKGNAFVPQGLSVWELSVEKDYKRKAEADFKKRLAKAYGVDKKQTTFVFVTPRQWRDKDTWRATKKKRGAWKDIRVYDSESLAQWLETAKGVDNWIARLLGRRPQAADDIENHWQNLTDSTEPRLSAKVFLASREGNIKRFAGWFKSSPSVLAFESSAPNNVIDFIAACYACSADPECSLPAEVELNPHDMAAKTLIVQSVDAWREAVTGLNHLLLIPYPDLPVDAEMKAEALRHGHHVLLCAPRFATNRNQAENLSRPMFSELEQALVSSGLNEKDARSSAHQSGGSLAVLKRALSRFPAVERPAWSRLDNARGLVPFILLGGWDDANDADRQALEKLSGKPYTENLNIANRWLSEPDSPIARVLSTWSMVSREDSWRLLAGNINSADIETFRGIAIDILAEADPKFDLPPQQRFYAAIQDKTAKYSARIRNGICETLALLGCKSGHGILQISTAPEGLAKEIVGRLLNADTTWRQWASLPLPILAEAAPDVFLSAVESDLKKPEPVLRQLFTNTGDVAGFSDCTYAELLWALETLAWHPAYLTRLSRVLARLHEIAPEKKGWSNSPLNSLTEIFLPWSPNTTATVGQRITALKGLAKKHQGVAWALLLTLMPDVTPTSSPTHKPLWLGWSSLDWAHATTNLEYREQVEACAGLLVDMVGTAMERWLNIIEKFHHLPERAQLQLLDRMQQLDLTRFNTDDRREISDKIRGQVSRHRRFSDAYWAMPEGMVTRLDGLRRRFEPEDPIAKHLWLFDHWSSTLEELAEDWDDNEAIKQQKRSQALREIYERGGIDDILKLAEQCGLPYVVGNLYVETALCSDSDPIIPDLLDAKEDALIKFSMGVASALFQQQGWVWVETLPMATWSARQTGMLLSALPFTPKAWAMVERYGTDAERVYWRNADLYWKHQDADKRDLESAVAKLLDYCPQAAAGFIARALRKPCKVNPQLVTRALQRALEDDSGDAVTHRSAYYHIQLLQYLQRPDTSVDTDELAMLEWQFLGLLDDLHGASPVTLDKKLQHEPQFYCELIRAIFRSDKVPKDKATPPSERNKAVAQNAYSLLTQWDAIPGTDTDANGDRGALMNWVNSARAICAESGHLDVCDSHIGQMLAKEPEQENADWPGIATRDVIDEIDSEALTRGFEVGIHNKRGVYSKSIGEGGAQERTLAGRYEKYAQNCEMEWPVTAAALRRVAKAYEAESEREDERADRWD